MKLKNCLASLFGASALFVSSHAAAVNVGLELMLLVDVSGSVDASEYALQKQGYVDAFNSAAVQNAILNSVGGSIAVTYIEWSGQGQQSSLVGWTLIDSAASASTFAAAINGVSRAFAGQTAIQDAMLSQSGQFATNGFDASRQVIDVSGDGADNNSSCVTSIATQACGRDAALANGVDTINGLPILGEGGLLAYYQNNVAGGGGFTLPAANFADFGRAIEAKLIREVTGVPEPTSLALAGLALAGLGVARRRTANA